MLMLIRTSKRSPGCPYLSHLLLMDKVNGLLVDPQIIHIFNSYGITMFVKSLLINNIYMYVQEGEGYPGRMGPIVYLLYRSTSQIFTSHGAYLRQNSYTEVLSIPLVAVSFFPSIKSFLYATIFHVLQKTATATT
jgi:hypothetical protein